MKKGRKLSQKSLEILGKVFEAGVTVVKDFIEISEYDRFVRLKLYKQLYNLERRGYVEIKRDKKNQSFFHLTPRGRLSVLKYLHLERLQKKRWDRHWRVIIFDIPEKLKKWRDYLRHDLRELGFYPLQESVYITPYPVTGELDEKLKDWGLKKYFRYLTVTEIDRETELKKEFNLK